LKCFEIALSLEGGQVQVELPWPPNEAPSTAIPLLMELKEREQEMRLFLQQKAIVHRFTMTAHNKGQLMVDEAISFFEPLKVWDLPQEKVDIIEGFFNEPGASTYIQDIHGPPGSKEQKDWQRLKRRTIKEMKKAIGANKVRKASTHFQDACYFSCCTELLKARCEKARRYQHLVRNLQYSEGIDNPY